MSDSQKLYTFWFSTLFYTLLYRRYMEIIVITQPTFISNEAAIIQQLLSLGVARVHIRKPNMCIESCRQLIKDIPACFHAKLSLHDNFALTREFEIGGIHLNHRNPTIPKGFKGIISKSCHSFQEVIENKETHNYLFLSPIFNSISNQGYLSAFTHESLTLAHKQQIIETNVYALGGVTLKNIHKLYDYGFGGAAILGDIWEKVGTTDFEKHVIKLVTH